MSFASFAPDDDVEEVSDVCTMIERAPRRFRSATREAFQGSQDEDHGASLVKSTRTPVPKRTGQALSENEAAALQDRLHLPRSIAHYVRAV